MSHIFVASVPTASGTKARTMPSLCGAPSFKHYRRSATNKAPRKRTFLVEMTKYSARAEPIAAFGGNHNAVMVSGGVCCDHIDQMPCGGNGNNGGRGNRGDGGNGNNNNFGPQDSGNNDGSFARLLQSCSHALLGALALIAAAAIVPASASAAASNLAFSGARQLSASSPGSGSGRPRSKVMHVACKGSTLVVPLCDPKAAEALPSRAKIVDAPIELSGREVAIINRRQYCVRESMLV
ncbi:hypothetical protein PLESTB_001328900 [Pleodorina starrii]|uniref:Uncharacterized protein n=1 Tax=Pleodorina starrii TaxID=330485 RepID=A0A9W6BVD9_9CHLO|nr:hypothetical protein PLESTM_001624900 [Pleodorina starrii]GLC58191.1 hypothetical protein PLESTB_001328900 [Pleodorina starrii]GLC75541.1 hypothetical protein PLESTF_001654900 [Pleodorina starrii]